MTDESGRPSAGSDSRVGTGTVRARYDWAATPPPMAVIETVAVALDRKETAFEPLYESVDPDALDALLQSNGSSATAGEVTVRFTLAGRQVPVHGSGEVVVRADSPGRLLRKTGYALLRCEGVSNDLLFYAEHPSVVEREQGATRMTELNERLNRDRTGYDPMTDTYHHQYGWDSPERLSSAVIAAVATAADTEPTELEPLYDCVDPDALDALFRPLSEDRPRSHGRFLFSLDEYEVAVHGHGEIIVNVSDINTSRGRK